MAKYCLKKVSKRMTCKKRYKIAKKVRDHNKKMKKEDREKKRQQKKGKRNEKMISVPNKCPFKEELLAEAEARRAELEEEKKQRKSELKSAKQLSKVAASTNGVKGEGKNRFADKSGKGVNDADEAMDGYDDFIIEPQALMTTITAGDSGDKNSVEADSQRRLAKPAVKAFAGELRRIIESADVVLEVLDARDPMGTRSRPLEDAVLGAGKRLVLLLNKIDLVPSENVLAWVTHLRRDLPCLAFKASTQHQRDNIGQIGFRASLRQLNAEKYSSKCMGADLVMRLLGNYSRNKSGDGSGGSVRTTIRVGIVGFPNVGKSSVINSLKRRRICAVGATAGLTRQAQEVQLDSHTYLLDSPGVVLSSKSADADPGELALRNAVRLEALDDPITPVQAILRRCSVRSLMLHYNIARFASTDEFLNLVARKIGRLKKGGVPDAGAAARRVLMDWTRGKLRYYTEPPASTTTSTTDTQEVVSSLASNGERDQLLSTFSREFDLDALDLEVRTLVESMSAGGENGGDDVVMMGDDGGAALYDPSVPIQAEGVVTLAPKRPKKGEKEPLSADAAADSGGKKVTFSAPLITAVDDAEFEDEYSAKGRGAQLNRAMRVVMKKRKKQKKRLAKAAENLTEGIAGMMGGGASSSSGEGAEGVAMSMMMIE